MTAQTALDAIGAADPMTRGRSAMARGDFAAAAADFLRRLQYGPWLVELTDLTIVPNPVLRGNVLQVSIGLRAPIALEQ